MTQIKKVRDYDYYVMEAMDSFNSGFRTKSSQKEALSCLNYAYDQMTSIIKEAYLSIEFDDRTTSQHQVYDEVPFDLFQWRPKHETLVLSVFPEMKEAVQKINILVDLRSQIKASEIIPAERKNNARIDSVTKAVHEIIALRKQQFNEGLRLHDVFGNLPVSVTWHTVRNQYGTTFWRVFYYMNGKLTPLNVILAVLDAKAHEEK